jgi:hypothetical protein
VANAAAASAAAGTVWRIARRISAG